MLSVPSSQNVPVYLKCKVKWKSDRKFMKKVYKIYVNQISQKNDILRFKIDVDYSLKLEKLYIFSNDILQIQLVCFEKN